LSIQKKYIPKTWDQIIGQEEIVTQLKEYKSISDMPNLAFIGRAGIGKTACAYVLAKSLNIPIVELNASDDRGIDVVRGTIKTLLFTEGERIILMDEMDALTGPAQDALKRSMERSLNMTGNRLIFTINRRWKIVDPILSRCTIFYFNPLTDENIKTLSTRIFREESIKFNTKEDIIKSLDIISKSSRGDARRAINIIGKILNTEPDDIISILKRESVEIDFAEETFNYAVKGNWEKCLRSLENLLVQQNIDGSVTLEIFYRGLEKLDIDPVLKYPLYERLADVERALQIQCNPLIQFSSFLMSVVGVTHYKGE